MKTSDETHVTPETEQWPNNATDDYDVLGNDRLIQEFWKHHFFMEDFLIIQSKSKQPWGYRLYLSRCLLLLYVATMACVHLVVQHYLHEERNWKWIIECEKEICEFGIYFEFSDFDPVAD